MIYFWSDTHFNHEGIIRYCNRPYADAHEMNESMISLWNGAVGPTDTIYHLGDFGFPSKREGDDLETIFGRLNGHKHLVIGNHDEKNPKALKLPWESQQKLGVVKAEGMRAVVCHYPLETWASAHKGYLHFHGHSHGSLKRKIAHRFDVGVDVFSGPVLFENLMTLATAQEFQAVDHHGDL